MSQAGDFYVVHSTDVQARIIQAGTSSRWNHTGILIDDHDNLIEALGSGVTLGNLSKYSGRDYLVLSPPLTDVQRAQAVQTAQAAIGEPYDRFAVAGFVIDWITGGSFVFGRNKHSICSALVAICYASAGVEPPQDPRRMSPGDLMKWFNFTPV